MRAIALVLLEDMATHKFNEDVAALTKERNTLEAMLPPVPVETVTPQPIPVQSLVALPQPTAPESDKVVKNPSVTPTTIPVSTVQPIVAVPQIDLSRIALADDLKVKEHATKLNNNIAELNQKSKEMELWKISLVGDEQVKKLQTKDPTELVKNYVKESYQSQ